MARGYRLNLHPQVISIVASPRPDSGFDVVLKGKHGSVIFFLEHKRRMKLNEKMSGDRMATQRGLRTRNSTPRILACTLPVRNQKQLREGEVIVPDRSTHASRVQKNSKGLIAGRAQFDQGSGFWTDLDGERIGSSHHKLPCTCSLQSEIVEMRRGLGLRRGQCACSPLLLGVRDQAAPSIIH